MKKGRIILIVIVVLAVVSGVFAFKVQRSPIVAYSITGNTMTSFIVNGKTYRTVVPLCSSSEVFTCTDGSNFTLTMTDLFKPIKGYTTILGVSVSATSLKFVCTSTWTCISDGF
jgi:hypothetical protein